MKGILDEGPIQLVKSFFQVYFQDYVRVFPFHLPEVGYVFLDNNFMVIRPFFGQEAGLVGTNNGGERV